MAVSKTRPERRTYYSSRTGKVSDPRGIDLAGLKRGFRQFFTQFEKEGYFQEAFGYEWGKDWWPGKLGDVELHFQRRVRKQNLWPIPKRLDAYSEDDLFDVIELLFDHASKGVEKSFSVFGGTQYKSFDRKKGRREFRDAINDLLSDYDRGYELTIAGEIWVLPEPGMDALMLEKINHSDPANVARRVEVAKQKFLRRGSTIEDQRDAVRDLVDVLEFMKKNGQLMLNRKDDGDLFNIANNFGIRHHNQHQKIDYSEDIWLSWMFYFYLATIHACDRLMQKQGVKP